MKKPIIKFFDKIIVLFLSIAGFFTACKSPSDANCEYNRDDGPYIKYGPPPAFYLIKGVVSDNSNSLPIHNIQVINQKSDGYADTTYTSLSGEYGISEYYIPNSAVQLKFEDIDGEENGGHFITKEMNIKNTNEDLEKINECNRKNGIYVKIKNIKLQKKN
jgi:putative lipoprotein (rSAM/lipoprotein system)